MSYEQLKQRDIFLPREHWGEADLGSSTNPWVVLVVAVLAAGAVVLMVAGGGAALTWVGAGLFMLLLYGYAVLSSRAIDAQNRRIRDLIQDSGGDASCAVGPPDAAPR